MKTTETSKSMPFNKGMAEAVDRWFENGGRIVPETKREEVRNENTIRNNGNKTHRQMAML